METIYGKRNAGQLFVTAARNPPFPFRPDPAVNRMSCSRASRLASGPSQTHPLQPFEAVMHASIWKFICHDTIQF
ncbi:protein of unknown function (plasmid) [Methylocella tundrae]|uniref:Uncharacterized protein n=1 Tax=Methylocella tundrae TaxID=227605 RepID=A0A4U8Z7E6_METTU|nr:protein of unknown function [Methylocella tundrae]